MKFLIRKIYCVHRNFMCGFRTWYCRRLFKKFGKKSRILGRVSLILPENMSIGSNSTLNDGVILNGYQAITIGSNVHISARVAIMTASLKQKPDKDHDRRHTGRPITIEDGVWVGVGVIILEGVTIGRNAIIGAGAVVNKDVPANTVYAGVPAKFLKKIDPLN